ncbi:MAG: magnesium transporter [Armatimonadetes bacterium]|jgi:magnesium transporter|nr:magnesium transporter [Armatimonadota bacterium]
MYAAAVHDGRTKADEKAAPRVLTGWLERGTEQLWIDVKSPTAEELAFIRDRFNLHPLAIEECDHSGVRPKIEEFGDHLFIVFHGINHNEGADVLDTVEFKVFLRRGLLITIHDKSSRSIGAIQGRVQQEPQLLPKRGVDTILHNIIDAVIDHYFPILEAYEEQLERIETNVFRDPTSELLEEMLVLQRRFLTLHRIIQPQLDILGALSCGRFDEIEPADLVYFRDVYDHLQRISERLQVAREMLTGAMQCYLSQTSNRMNSVMKSMAVLATVLLPASFITSLLGMNLDHLPGRSAPDAFWLIAGFSVSASALLVLVLKRLRWL